MIIPGIVSATFKNLPFERVIAIAAESNLKAIEWSENWHIRENDTDQAAYIAALTALNGLKVASFGSYYRLGKGMDFMPRIRVALALGAKVIRIWGGDKPSSELSAEEREALIREAREIADKASGYGLSIALEWHKNTVTDTNESGLSFLEDVDRPNFKTFWQPTQALSVTERREGLGKIGKYLSNIHVYYWDATGRRPFAEGLEDWKGYLSEIDKEKDHYALLEFVKDDSIEQLKEDAEAFLGLLKEI